MADSDAGVISNELDNAAPITPPEAKKQRAPRGSKLAAKALLAASNGSAEKSGKTKAVRQKRGAKADAPPAAVEASDVSSTIAKAGARGKRNAKELSALPVSAADAIQTAGDEMADLILLEQENQRLRRALAGKLRAENADLRKRLGQD
jgi:hypothetical protein